MASDAVKKMESRIRAVNTYEEKVRPFLADEDRQYVIDASNRDMGKEPQVHVPAKRGRKPKNHSGAEE